MIIENPDFVYFSMYQNLVNKNDPSFGYFDDGHCPVCNAHAVKTAKLPGDGSPYICKDCWSYLALMEGNRAGVPYNIVGPFNFNKVSLQDVQRAVTYFENEVKKRRLKKQRFAAMLAAYLAYEV